MDICRDVRRTGGWWARARGGGWWARGGGWWARGGGWWPCMVAGGQVIKAFDC